VSLTDDPARPRKYVFPDGAVISPGGFLACYADSVSQPPGLHLGFALDDEGEGLWLYDRTDRGGTLLDSVRFGRQLPDLSLGRLADGSWSLTQPTFGAINRPQPLGDPRRLRLNEWLASHIVFADDFIELFNPEPLPVSLDGLFLTDAPSGAPLRASLPSLAFIAPHGFLAFDADESDAPGHINLSLDDEFGTLALTDITGAVLDVVAYGPQLPDVSEGRVPDGFGWIVPSFGQPTPGRTNAGAPSAFELTWQRTGGEVTFTLAGAQAGRRYRLEGRAGVSGDWAGGEEVTAANATVSFAPVPASEAVRFFRAVLLP